MPTLGILLAAPGELARALRYAKAAHELAIEVRVFVTFEAISILGEAQVDALVEVAEVIACAQTVQARGVQVRPGVKLGSQFDHAEIANQVDRYLALT